MTDHRIPVTLLTGFLGSGKTTLLNKLLAHPEMKDTAVIINELGETGLDHILAQHVESSYVADNTVLLQSGCLCCNLSGELADTMRDLYFKRSLQAIPQFKRLIIETTGMADPGPILGNLMNEAVIESVYQLDAVVVTVDCGYGPEQIQTHAEARKQVAVADVLLITKSDLANEEAHLALKETLLNINPGATQHDVILGHIDPSYIIDVGLFAAKDQQPTPERWLRTPTNARSNATSGLFKKSIQHDGIETFTVALPTQIEWKTFKSILLKLCQTHGEGLLRLKGILHCIDQPCPLAIHAVHYTPYPATPLLNWQETSPISRIVVIGKALNKDAIRNLLTQF